MDVWLGLVCCPIMDGRLARGLLFRVYSCFCSASFLDTRYAWGHEFRVMWTVGHSEAFCKHHHSFEGNHVRGLSFHNFFSSFLPSFFLF